MLSLSSFFVLVESRLVVYTIKTRKEKKNVTTACNAERETYWALKCEILWLLYKPMAQMLKFGAYLENHFCENSSGWRRRGISDSDRFNDHESYPQWTRTSLILFLWVQRQNQANTNVVVLEASHDFELWPSRSSRLEILSGVRRTSSRRRPSGWLDPLPLSFCLYTCIYMCVLCSWIHWNA